MWIWWWRSSNLWEQDDFFCPKKITNAFTRVNFSDASTRVQTYDETSDASRRVYFSNAFTCVQIYDAPRCVYGTRLDASDVSFWTRLNASSVAFRTHLKCVFKRVYTQYFFTWASEESKQNEWYDIFLDKEISSCDTIVDKFRTIWYRLHSYFCLIEICYICVRLNSYNSIPVSSFYVFKKL